MAVVCLDGTLALGMIESLTEGFGGGETLGVGGGGLFFAHSCDGLVEEVSTLDMRKTLVEIFLPGFSPVVDIKIFGC